jgi:hypothetical protein
MVPLSELIDKWQSAGTMAYQKMKCGMREEEQIGKETK